MKPTVHIDGSLGEGGGQILRTSLSLAVLAQRPVAIERIRAGRSKPGLQPQHLAAVRAAAALCAGTLEGAEVGSTRLLLTPNAPVSPGHYHFDIGTAGAATLVLQTVLLPLAFADGPSRVTVTGGTHVPHAPTVEYLVEVYDTLLARSGLQVAFESPSAGFYPRGGGEIRANIPAVVNLNPIELTERGHLRSVKAFVLTARLPQDVARRGTDAVTQGLQSLAVPLTVEIREAVSPGPGAAIVLVAEHAQGRAGFSAIGARGRPMEAVAEEACVSLRAWHRTETACDEHLADQLVLPMALVPETSRWTTSRVTDHLKTVLAVVSRFLPVDASCQENADGSGTVTLRGASLSSIMESQLGGE